MIPNIKKKYLLLIIIISFIIILVGTFLFAEHLSRQNAPKKISSILDNIQLKDHNGFKFNFKSLKGQPSLLFFGFTHCPEICPTTLGHLSEITENLKNEIIPTNIIFVTLDPKRDTQKHLKEYIQYFNKNIIGVIGKLNQIKEFANNWGVFFEEISNSKDSYTLNHTATVFMLDKNGNFKGTISWGENEKSITQKIINLSKF